MVTRERRVVLPNGSSPRYSPTGHLLYSVAGTIWAARFDARSAVVQADAAPVLAGVRHQASGAVDFDIAADGSIVYVPGDAQGIAGGDEFPRTLVWVDRAGREEPVEAPPRAYRQIRLSPDGARAAVEVRD